MPDDPKPSRPLSEIGHLFLSSIRQQQMQGKPMPVRRPPGAVEPPVSNTNPHPSPAKPAAPRRDMTIDLSPEEFAQVYGETPSDEKEAAPQELLPTAPVSAVIASHLNGKQMERVRQYAKHLAGKGQRVGLIVADAAEFKLLCFDGVSPAAGASPTTGADTAQSGRLHASVQEFEAGINELSFDLDRWLLVVGDSRSDEGRELLAATDHWVALCTCDPDGVVACYRTLKGLSDVRRPRLSLAVLESLGVADAGRIHHKLAVVCKEFLGTELEQEPPVKQFPQATEIEVMTWKPRNQAASDAAPAWGVVSQFLARARAGNQRPAAPQASTAAAAGPAIAPAVALAKQDVAAAKGEAASADIAQVIELAGTFDKLSAGQNGDGACIIAAVLNSGRGNLVQCPITPPPCPEARLAIGRDRSLVLLAVAREGLADLRGIALAYRWLIDNRPLIAMALPQLAIDAAQTPRLRLLVDQADLSADVLNPLLQSSAVQVQTYRRVRWGDKMGLLLENA